MKALQVISDGGGVQSSTMKKLGAKGAFGLVQDIEIFADTKQEPESVYRWVESTRSEKSVTVTAGDLAAASLVVRRSEKSGNLWMKGLIPAFVKNSDGTKGILGRKCTLNFKIEPIRRYLRNLLKAQLSAWKKRHKDALSELRDWEKAVQEAKKKKNIPPIRPASAWLECQDDAVVDLWIGISTDEADRAKESKVPWIRNKHTLLDHRISRSHCLKEVPGAPRSACKFCPFHSDFEWQRLKDEEPEEFESAAKFEDDLQRAAKGVIDGIPFLHDTLTPIRDVKFDTSLPSHQQLYLFSNECEGMCGV
jgi:hypothetical protein